MVTYYDMCIFIFNTIRFGGLLTLKDFAISSSYKNSKNPNRGSFYIIYEGKEIVPTTTSCMRPYEDFLADQWPYIIYMVVKHSNPLQGKSNDGGQVSCLSNYI